jgi:hypothetical protein
MVVANSGRQRRNFTPAEEVAALFAAHEAGATAIHAHDGNLIIGGTVQQLTAGGVTSAAGTYRPTKVADEGISAKLGINLAYLRRLREHRPDLWDANVNGWLHGNDLAGIAPDDRKFLVRLFQTDGGSLGVVRAVLSDSYKVIDNLDALMATLDGIRQAGTEVEFDGLDLSERRLYARVVAPQITPVRGQGAVIEVVHPFLFALRRVEMVARLAEQAECAAAISGERDRVRTDRGQP